MKRKIIISVVLCLFAGLTVLNIGLTNRPDNSDTTLDLISVMVKAFDEGEGETVTCPPIEIEEIEYPNDNLIFFCGDYYQDDCIIRWFRYDNPETPVIIWGVWGAGNGAPNDFYCLPDAVD